MGLITPEYDGDGDGAVGCCVNLGSVCPGSCLPTLVVLAYVSFAALADCLYTLGCMRR
jgi:hypothetical protein